MRRKLADHAAVFYQLVEFGEVITSNSENAEEMLYLYKIRK